MLIELTLFKNGNLNFTNLVIKLFHDMPLHQNLMILHSLNKSLMDPKMTYIICHGIHQTSTLLLKRQRQKW